MEPVDRLRTDELRQLVARLAELAYDRTLTPPDAMRRIRDELADVLGVFIDPSGEQ